MKMKNNNNNSTSTPVNPESDVQFFDGNGNPISGPSASVAEVSHAGTDKVLGTATIPVYDPERLTSKGETRPVGEIQVIGGKKFLVLAIPVPSELPIPYPLEAGKVRQQYTIASATLPTSLVLPTGSPNMEVQPGVFVKTEGERINMTFRLSTRSLGESKGGSRAKRSFVKPVGW